MGGSSERKTFSLDRMFTDAFPPLHISTNRRNKGGNKDTSHSTVFASTFFAVITAS